MTVTLGKTQVSLLDPPNDGIVVEGEKNWKIGRNCYGMVVLRLPGEVHPDFINGMDLVQFCTWINEKTQ